MSMGGRQINRNGPQLDSVPNTLQGTQPVASDAGTPWGSMFKLAQTLARSTNPAANLSASAVLAVSWIQRWWR